MVDVETMLRAMQALNRYAVGPESRFSDCRNRVAAPPEIFASSAESVGRFWFRESSQVMMEGNFHSVRPPSTVQVKGRISMATSVHVDLAKVMVALSPAADRMVSPVFMAKVSDNGLLTFDKPIPSDVYRARIGVPEGYYVKSIQYAGTDVTGGLINIPEAGGDLVIGISGGTGQLEVRVEEENRAAAGSLHYVVVRSETDEGGERVYMAVTRDDGTVVLKNMPPGRYRAYAFRSADITAVKAAETLRILEEFGTTVEVSGSTLASATVRVVPPDRAGVAFQGSTKFR